MKKNENVKKGFTLIELLVVISVLALVMSISMYAVTTVINNAKKKTYATTVNEIENAANEYVLENSDDKPFLLDDDNTNIEYQCVKVINLIEQGFLHKDVTNSVVNDNGRNVGIDDYIYIERNSNSKAIVKSVYIMDEKYTNYCNIVFKTKGDITFTSNPDKQEWSKSKVVTINYRVINPNRDETYKYLYTWDGEKNVENIKGNEYASSREVKVISPGTISAYITDSSNNNIGNNSYKITKIDNTGPVISFVNNEEKYVSKIATIELKIEDSQSGLDKNRLNSEIQDIIKNKIEIRVGDNVIKSDNISLNSTNNDNIYALVIRNEEYNGKVHIKINEDTFFDMVVDEVKNGNKLFDEDTNIIFDNIPPELEYESTDDLFKNDQSLTLTCDDDSGISGYYVGTGNVNDDTEFSNLNSNSFNSTITSSGKYYLACKDGAGNTSTTVINYWQYTLKYMLLKVAGIEDNYTTSDYSELTSLKKSYLLPEKANINLNDLKNGISVPTGSNKNKYKGLSVGTPGANKATLVTSNPQITSNTTYTLWYNRNVLNIKYKVRNDETLKTGSYNTNLYSWDLDSNRFVRRTTKGSGETTITFNNYRYGVTEINIYDNLSSAHFYIGKSGFTPKTGEEWVCTSGCKTNNMVLSQSPQSININNSICDITSNDCDITLSVNWASSIVNVMYHMNGGRLASQHGSNISTDGNYLTLNGNRVISKFNYNESIAPNGLANYNNSDYINIVRDNYSIPSGQEWYKQGANGALTYFNQSDSTINSNTLCDASNGDCTVTVYANWQPNIYKITLNKDGGTGGTNEIFEKYNTGWYLSSSATSNISVINIPKKDGYTFTGYYTNNNTEIINEDGEIVANNTFFTADSTVTAKWRVNKINIKYHVNNGTMATEHGDSFAVNANGYVTNNGNEIIDSYNYGSNVPSTGLKNYNNKDYINIIRVGYIGKKNAEWNTKADGTGTSYDQATGSFAANTLCDAKNGDCTVTMYVNWVADNSAPVIQFVMKKQKDNSTYSSDYYKTCTVATSCSSDAKWFADAPKLVYTITDSGSGIDSVKFYYNDDGKHNATLDDNHFVKHSSTGEIVEIDLNTSNFIDSDGNYVVSINGAGNRFVKVVACDKAHNCSAKYVNFKLDKVFFEFDAATTNNAKILNLNYYTLAEDGKTYNPISTGVPLVFGNSDTRKYSNLPKDGDMCYKGTKNCAGHYNSDTGEKDDNVYFGVSCIDIRDFFRVFKVKVLSESDNYVVVKYASCTKSYFAEQVDNNIKKEMVYYRQGKVLTLTGNGYNIDASDFGAIEAGGVNFTGYKFWYEAKKTGRKSNVIWLYTQYTARCGYKTGGAC